MAYYPNNQNLNYAPNYNQNNYPYLQNNQNRFMNEQAYNYQNYMNQMQQNLIKGRAVTSIDEVKGSMIDLDGSLFVFPDIGNNKIHTKQINLDGTATIRTYVLELENKKEEKQYIEKGEFENIVNKMNERINQLQNKINKTKE